MHVENDNYVSKKDHMDCVYGILCQLLNPHAKMSQVSPGFFSAWLCPPSSKYILAVNLTLNPAANPTHPESFLHKALFPTTLQLCCDVTRRAR